MPRAPPNLSYAERLRQAASQRSAASEQSEAAGTAAGSPTSVPSVEVSPAVPKAAPIQVPESKGPKAAHARADTAPAPVHGGQAASSNVWEARKREREARTKVASPERAADAAQAMGALSLSPRTHPSPSTPAWDPACAPPHESHDQDANGGETTPDDPDESWEPASLDEPVGTFEEDDVPPVHTTYGTPPDNEAWLQRIHMLNGGQPITRYGRTPPYTSRSGALKEVKPTSPHRAPQSPSSNGALPIPIVSPPYSPMPSSLPNSDGSFAPLRSSEQHAMHGYTDFARSAPMAYYAMVPVAMGEYPMDDRGYGRRGRGRGNGRGMRGRGPYMPYMQQPMPAMMPYMIVPGAPMCAMPPNAPMPPPEGAEVQPSYPSPVPSNTGSQDNASDGDETRSDVGTPSVSGSDGPLESTPSSRSASQSRGSHPMGASEMPMGGMPPGMGMPYGYAMPGPPPFDTRFPPMMPMPTGYPMPMPGMMPPPPMMPKSPTLPHQLLTQVEFYFSNANLDADFFLRQQMDDKGYVPLDTVLGFKRVQNLLQSTYPNASPSDRARLLALLRTALEKSRFLALNEDQSAVRRQDGWERYILYSADKEP